MPRPWTPTTRDPKDVVGPGRLARRSASIVLTASPARDEPAGSAAMRGGKRGGVVEEASAIDAGAWSKLRTKGKDRDSTTP